MLKGKINISSFTVINLPFTTYYFRNTSYLIVEAIPPSVIPYVFVVLGKVPLYSCREAFFTRLPRIIKFSAADSFFLKFFSFLYGALTFYVCLICMPFPQISRDTQFSGYSHAYRNV